MATEVGHHPNRGYREMQGNYHLNGAALFDADEKDQKNVVAGKDAGYRIARGEVTLDGSNPTSVLAATTGLATIVAAAATLKRAVAPADDQSMLSVDYGGGVPAGQLDIHAWKNTGGTDPTLVASTNATAVISWWAIGT